MIHLGIDNGSTGYMTAIADNGTVIIHRAVPCTVAQDYHKSRAKEISRLDWREFERCVDTIRHFWKTESMLVTIENPMTMRFNQIAVYSGMRFYESMIVTLERMKIPYQTIPAVRWQKAFLPEGVKGSFLIKKIANQRARELYPTMASSIVEGDSVLIAEWSRRNFYGPM